MGAAVAVVKNSSKKVFKKSGLIYRIHTCQPSRDSLDCPGNCTLVHDSTHYCMMCLIWKSIPAMVLLLARGLWPRGSRDLVNFNLNGRIKTCQQVKKVLLTSAAKFVPLISPSLETIVLLLLTSFLHLYRLMMQLWIISGSQWENLKL